MQNKFDMDTPKDEVERILKESIKKEIEETHKLGLSTRHMDERGIYDLYPDGTRIYIENEKYKKDTT